ncbi:hypothetical protein O1L60_33590 [Streptomyces diastatochromogenes]|nr:hypothetical protein [Streptomyces diastatochromogenes]
MDGGARLVTADELRASPGPHEPYDLVLLSVKSTGLDRAIEDLAPAVGPDTAVVPLLNGLAHIDALNARFGARAVLGGVAKVVTVLDDSGDIRRLAPLAHLAFGEQDGTVSARVERIRKVLEGAGIDAPVPADVLTAMWHKWVFITTFGTVTSLMRGTVGEVYDTPGGPALGPAVLDEAAAVAAGAGHPVTEEERAATLAVVSASGSPMVPSLYRDLVAGRPTEVEHLFGDLTDRARALGVATPPGPGDAAPARPPAPGHGRRGLTGGRRLPARGDGPPARATPGHPVRRQPGPHDEAQGPAGRAPLGRRRRARRPAGRPAVRCLACRPDVRRAGGPGRASDARSGRLPALPDRPRRTARLPDAGSGPLVGRGVPPPAAVPRRPPGPRPGRDARRAVGGVRTRRPHLLVHVRGGRGLRPVLPAGLTESPLQKALFLACYLPLAAWAPLLTVVAVAYHRRRAGRAGLVRRAGLLRRSAPRRRDP